MFTRLTNQLQELHFDKATLFIAQAALLGAQKTAAIHGLSSQALQSIYKVEAGSSPRTVADIQASKSITTFLHRSLPYRINEEETGMRYDKNTDAAYVIHVDPLDGTASYARGQRYSTTGIELTKEGFAQSAAVCHSFERELFVAEQSKGAYLFTLDDALDVTEEFHRLKTLHDQKQANGPTIYLDALFNTCTAPPKQELIAHLVKEFNQVNLRMTGSSIDHQRQVAAGRAELTIVDAVGGFYDFSGRLLIQESGGKFIDGQTLGNVTEKTTVALGGESNMVDLVGPIIQRLYRNYIGFY